MPLPSSDDWTDVPAKPALKAKVAADSGWEDVPAQGAAPGAAPATPTPAPPRPGAFTRFRQGLRTTMGFEPEGTVRGDLSQIGEGLKDEFTHPVESGKALLEGMGQSQQEVVDKAYQEQHSPNLSTKVKGFVRGAESAVPLVGPWLSHAGDTFSEGNYAGGAGEMLPGMVGAAESGDVPLRTRVGNFAAEKLRTPTGALKPGVTKVARAAGALGGYEAGHYGGAVAGGYLGPTLADMVIPDRTTSLPKIRTEPWEAPSEAAALQTGSSGLPTEPSLLNKLPIRETPFDRPLTPEQVPGEPLLRQIAERGDPRAGQELQRRGQDVLYVPEEGYPPPRESTTFSSRGGGTRPQSEAAPVPPKAGDSGTRAIDEATAAPYESTRARQTGVSAARLREEMRNNPAPEEYRGAERRASVRDIGTEDPMRTARMNQIREQLADPSLDLRDKIVLNRQLEDMKSNPFERTDPKEVDVRAAKAKDRPKMNLSEAAVASSKRSKGRTQRFASSKEK